MPGIHTHRFTGLMAPPSPEVEAGPFLALDYLQVKKFWNFEVSERRPVQKTFDNSGTGRISFKS